jgi:hypothetical protein
MLTLREAGLRLVKEGLTTLEEVLGITSEDEDFMASHVSAPANIRIDQQPTHANPAPLQFVAPEPPTSPPQAPTIATDTSTAVSAPTNPTTESESVAPAALKSANSSTTIMTLEGFDALNTPSVSEEQNISSNNTETLPASGNPPAEGAPKAGPRWKSGRANNEARLN